MNIVSFSVFQAPRKNLDTSGLSAIQLYHDSVPYVLRACLTLYPGWAIVIHHDRSLLEHAYGPVLAECHYRGIIHLREMPTTEELSRGMLWRMRPIWFEEGANIVTCRDMDSLPLPRDRAAVGLFEESSAPAQAFLDHPDHVGLMGGMSSYRAAAVRELFPTWESFETSTVGEHGWFDKLVDQHFLNRVLGAPWWDRVLTTNFTDKKIQELPHARVPEELLAADNLAKHAGAVGFNKQFVAQFYRGHSAIQPLRDAEAAAGYR